MGGRDGIQGSGGRGGQGGFGRGRGKCVKKKRKYKYKELKFEPHGSGQEKKSATFGKVHGMIILKNQERYENGINTAN